MPVRSQSSIKRSTSGAPGVGSARSVAGDPDTKVFDKGAGEFGLLGSAMAVLTFLIVMGISFLYIRFVGGNIRALTEE